MNATASGAFPLVGVHVTAATGGLLSTTLTLTLFVAVAPLLSVTVTTAVYVPATGYVYVGFATVDVAPFPNAQL